MLRVKSIPEQSLLKINKERRTDDLHDRQRVSHLLLLMLHFQTSNSSFVRRSIIAAVRLS